jgi:malate dehydrogenase
MTTIGIVGAGEVGGAVAHALARRDRVNRIVLVDGSKGVAAGKALDIRQAGPIEGFHTRLEGSDDPSRLIGCQVCVIADQAPAVEWSGDAGLASLIRLVQQTGTAPLVAACAGAAPLMLAAVREGGIPRDRFVGSAPEALAAAVKAIVAMEAGCSPSEVGLTVLGAPPAGFVVPWIEASIGGHALDRVFTQAQLARVEGRVGRLWPPGPFALGLAAAMVSEALVISSRRTWSVLNVFDGELGARDRVGVVPALLSTVGIVHRRAPELSGRDRVRLGTALGT